MDRKNNDCKIKMKDVPEGKFVQGFCAIWNYEDYDRIMKEYEKS